MADSKNQKSFTRAIAYLIVVVCIGFTTFLLGCNKKLQDEQDINSNGAPKSLLEKAKVYALAEKSNGGILSSAEFKERFGDDSYKEYKSSEMQPYLEKERKLCDFSVMGQVRHRGVN